MLVNAGDTILNAFDSTLQKVALKGLGKRGIDIKLNTRVLDVFDGSLVIKQSSYEGNFLLQLLQNNNVNNDFS